MLLTQFCVLQAGAIALRVLQSDKRVAIVKEGWWLARCTGSLGVE